uniref:Uncharacterized protein n=1 Tax=Acinetobacter phage P919 TaxID=3229763 RepID=A0AB39AIL1_9CAUD
MTTISCSIGKNYCAPWLVCNFCGCVKSLL